VLLTTPITLLALLKTVAYGWQQRAVAENAREVAEQGRELFDRLNLYMQHFGGVGAALTRAVEAYNKAVGSMELRLLPSIRKLRDLGVSTRPLRGPANVSENVRTVPAGSPEPHAEEGNPDVKEGLS
jgi:DNA recombination protein RmuC